MILTPEEEARLRRIEEAAHRAHEGMKKGRVFAELIQSLGEALKPLPPPEPPRLSKFDYSLLTDCNYDHRIDHDDCAAACRKAADRLCWVEADRDALKAELDRLRGAR